MENGEGVATIEKEPNEKKEERKPLKIRCALFFDGTLNNRRNTQARIDNSDEYKQHKAGMSEKEKKNNKGLGDSSYENDHTNISTLEANTLPTAKGHGEMISVYTEGAGSVNYGSDDTWGTAFGSGDTGVKMKVFIGINDAVSSISKGGDGDREPYEYIIEKLTIDVFGFSRGAAGARYCIYKMLKDKSMPLRTRLELAGFEVADNAINICFVGLFDTVSSYNGGQYLHTDNWLLALKSVSEAKKVVQLAAAEEHRRNFPLHNIKSAGGKGEQYYLPGVHSDVGGSYRLGETSDENMVVFRGNVRAAKRDKKWLTEKSGWYKPEEISEEIISYNKHDQPQFMQLKTKRSGISNAYCSIPLKIMAEFSRKSGIEIKAKLDRKASSKISKIPELKTLEDRIKAHIALGSSNSKPSYWINQQDKWYCDIRHDHLHFSAKCEIGLAPRIGVIDGKRKRYEFDG